MLFVALVLQILRDLSMCSLAACLKGGDDLGKVDALFQQLGVAVEWDGSYYHGESCQERDVKKTMRILAQNPSLLVVRIRFGAKDVPELQGLERCVIVVVPRGSTVEHAAIQFATAVHSLVPKQHASLLRSNHSVSKRCAELVVCNLQCECDASFAKAFKRLKTLVGGMKNAQNMLSSVHGARSNLVHIVDCLQRLKEEWKMEKGDLCKFMSNSVAAAVSGEKAAAFWEAVDKLKEEWKMEKGDLCKFVSDSVAAAVSGEKAAAFWEAVTLLKPLLSAGEMSSFMTDGVAARMKRGFGHDFATLIRKLGFKTVSAMLRDTSMLDVVPELATLVSGGESVCALEIARPEKRKALLDSLQSQKRQKK